MTAVSAELLQRTATWVWQHKMADVPLCNPRLEVAVVGWHPMPTVEPQVAQETCWLCILLTPWAINGVLIADAGVYPAHADVPALPLTQTAVQLPSGRYAFMHGQLQSDSHCLRFRYCSLFSPPSEFASQAQAMLTAQMCLQAFLKPESEPEPGALSTTEQAQISSAKTRAMDVPVPSRRRFLRGQGA